MELTKIGLLLELRDYYHFTMGQHATDYMQTTSKPGYEAFFNDNRQRLALMDELITEQEGIA